jgi:hypothetical protein
MDAGSTSFPALLPRSRPMSRRAFLATPLREPTVYLGPGKVSVPSSLGANVISWELTRPLSQRDKEPQSGGFCPKRDRRLRSPGVSHVSSVKSAKSGRANSSRWRSGDLEGCGPSQPPVDRCQYRFTATTERSPPGNRPAMAAGRGNADRWRLGGLRSLPAAVDRCQTVSRLRRRQKCETHFASGTNEPSLANVRHSRLQARQASPLYRQS